MMKHIPVWMITVALLASCSAPPPPERAPFGTTLAAVTTKAYENHTTVTMSDVTPFPWNRLYAFKPNTSPDAMDAALGFKWAKDYSDQTDTYCLLVFVFNSRVEQSLLFPRYRGDCKTLATVGPFTRKTAVFSLTSKGTTTGGQPFLQLHEGRT